MTQVGSSKDIVSQSITGVTDDLGNSLVSTSTDFGSSPLGVSARAQALYGIANPNFNLTPPAPDSPIEDQSNPLPFWSIDNSSDGEMSATSVFDATTQTFGVQLNPGTAAIDSTLTLTTRSYLLTDDNLALRQKALSVLSKSGTAGGTASQWNLTLSAIYYDATDTALSTAVIGTALDTGTWTSISGTTTPGGSAINSAAQYVDLSFKMTATAAVTGSAKATLKSLLLTTSTPGGGGSQSFLVTESFATSGTWTVPTGVTALVGVIATGGGGGGGGGGIRWRQTGNSYANGGGGGGSGAFVFASNLYIGDVATISVGIGAGGTGGTAGEKLVGNASDDEVTGQTGATGGATTFGPYLTASGGLGGVGGTAGTSQPIGTALGGAGGAATSLVFGGQAVAGTTGAGATMQSTPVAAGSTSVTAFSYFPFSPTPSAGAAGGSASTTFAGTTFVIVAPGAGGSAGYQGGGGGGACGGAAAGSRTTRAAVAAQRGAGGGGGAIGQNNCGAANVVIAGAGGSASIGSGAGGGGGGGLGVSNVGAGNLSAQNFVGGDGGNGAAGYVVIAYIA